MLNEQSDPTQPEQDVESVDTDETPPVVVEGLKVYDRPTRPVIPVWVWLLILVVGALLVWLTIQALQ